MYERSERQAKQAAASAERAKLALCSAALREHGVVAAAPTYDHLASLGFIDGVTQSVVPREQGTAHPGRKKASTDDNQSVALTVVPEMGGTWEQSPPDSARKLLTAVEPAVLSRHNLRTLGKQKQANTVPKDALMNLVEFHFNFDRTAKVPKWRNIHECIASLTSRCQALGARVSALQLPCALSNQPGGNAFWAVVPHAHPDGSEALMNKVTGKMKPLPDSGVKLHIDCCWSETRGTLLDESGLAVNYKCAQLFRMTHVPSMGGGASSDADLIPPRPERRRALALLASPPGPQAAAAAVAPAAAPVAQAPPAGVDQPPEGQDEMPSETDGGAASVPGLAGEAEAADPVFAFGAPVDQDELDFLPPPPAEPAAGAAGSV
ncbi:unnamed protein product [Prorocentrum cordatum]|uniref:Uncharacterized protein n=1 Tax=Prorocentrum cordatum TaxID=2364126 RepID=A0ABN9Q8M5_9DINO|nr:unnamed protein product [Polarella glacialis]